MSQNQLKIEVRDKIATLTEQNFQLVSGNSDYEVVFDFDKAWENHPVKTAIFVYGKKKVKRLFQGNVCKGVAIDNANVCYIGVSSGDIVTTTSARVECGMNSITDIGGLPQDPTAIVYNQLIELLNYYINVSKGLPIGGTSGQVIKKNSDSDFDYSWQDDIVGKSPPLITEIGQEYAVSNSPTEISAFGEWDSVGSPLTQRQRACVYGNGYYVIGGLMGEFCYSTNGKDWQKIEPFTSGVITSITYGKGIFIAIDSLGYVWISYEKPFDWQKVEIKWEQLPQGATQILEGVTYANGRFVLVGDNGLCAFSDDGIDWSEIRTPFEFRAVTSGEGKYVAVGVEGAIAVSYNGDTWADYSESDITNQYRAVAYGNGLFVAGGQGGIIRYSPNGENWTTATTNSTSTISYIRGIVYVYGKFYAVMYTSSGSGEIWVSEDASTWAVQKETPNRLWCITEGNGILITSGDNGTIYSLNLGVVWHENEPTLKEGQYLWQRQFARLSDGSVIYGEARHILHSSTKHNYTAEEVGAIPITAKGTPNGVAELDENGIVVSTQLPSYVDSVEEYPNKASFPLYGETSKIYIDLSTNLTYRWGGTSYVPIASDLALGETSQTAHRGDHGKIAYNHSQTIGNPHKTTAKEVGALPIGGGTIEGDINLGTNHGFAGTTASGNIFDIIRLINSTRFQVGGTYPYLEFRGKGDRPTYNGLDMALAGDTLPIEAISTDGISYEANVPSISAESIDELVGKSIIIIPNKDSTNASSVTLNVNGLGAKFIKRWDNLHTNEYWSFTSKDWLRANYPIRIIFNGTYWIIEGMNKPYATDLFGQVPITSGGTGATTAEQARANLGLKKEVWKFTLDNGEEITKEVYVK